MDEIIEYLKKSLDDNYFSKKEKKSLKALLKEYGPSAEQLNRLSGKIHELAKARITPENYDFIIQWMEQSSRAIWQSSIQESDSFFSPGDECRNAIVHHLNKSSREIKICVFTISDNIISDSIISAHNRGVSVKIITDNDKSMDRGSDIAQFSGCGIDVKMDNTSNHMHHKFMLTDNQVLLTGSYNWTRSAALYNHENILRTTQQSVIAAYSKEFDDLWKEMTDY